MRATAGDRSDVARRGARTRGPVIAWALTVAVCGALLLAASASAAPLPPVVAPPENPVTEAKRVLGKILFWDEQLSSDDTVACGTCHLPGRGGADPRRTRHPGPDGTFTTADDVFASPGVIRRDSAGAFAPHASFAFAPQVTGRGAPPAITGASFAENFWDGRAGSRFLDPETGAVAIAAGGALENQAAGPPLSSTEMAREGRTWADITAKLTAAAPLGLASNLPADVDAAIRANPTYPKLFRAAFGDDTLSARRIAFAIATYERTLVADQTPWDRFDAGDTSALTAQQIRGTQAFQTSRCNDCHTAPLFSDASFRNIGLRPSTEDTGREQVTGTAADRGKMKVPSLRSVGLRASFMHNGQFTTLTDVLRFYARAPGTTQFTDNRDPIMPQINLPPGPAGDIQAFLATGLTDPRVAAETFPFDRPTLNSERTDRASVVSGSGRTGSGAVTPKMLAPMPAHLGNTEFRLGVHGGLGGAQAFLAVASAAPAGSEITGGTLIGPIQLAGTGNGTGYGTASWPIPDDVARDGEKVWFQWRVTDPAATNGVALSPVAAVTLFAPTRFVPPAPVVTDGSDLFVVSGSFAIDWRAHGAGRNADTLVLRGALATAGIKGIDGAVLSVSAGGTEMLSATLDAAGRARSEKGASPEYTVRFDPSSGAFTVNADGIDLRDATGLSALAGAGDVELAVEVSLRGAGLATETAAAALPFAWKTKAQKLTRGSYSFADDGSASGAFRVSAAEVRIAGDGSRSVRLSGSIDAAGDLGFAPTDDIVLTVGAETLTIPVAQMQLRGIGRSLRLLYRTPAGTSPSVDFTYSARRRAFTLALTGLGTDSFPEGSPATPTLPVELATSNAEGAAEFTTAVPLVRQGASSVWRGPSADVTSN